MFCRAFSHTAEKPCVRICTSAALALSGCAITRCIRLFPEAAIPAISVPGLTQVACNRTNKNPGAAAGTGTSTTTGLPFRITICFMAYFLQRV